MARLSRWWLLLIPAGILLLLLSRPIRGMVWSQLSPLVDGPVTGPPNAFNQPDQSLPESQLLGFYRLSGEDRDRLREQGIEISVLAGFELKAGNVVEVREMPIGDVRGVPRACAINGSGSWKINHNQLYLSITKTLPALSGAMASCPPEDLVPFALLAGSSSFGFWEWIGDPDEHKGFTYRLETD